MTLSGVAMLLVLAVRHGWFGPGARVTAGAFLAALLGGLGVRGGARDRDPGAAVGSAPVALVATGAAAAYLDVVAATALYGWLPALVGLALCVAVAVAGLAVARRWSSELLAVLLVAGAGALSPVVAGGAGWLLSAVLGVLAVVGWWAGAGRHRPEPHPHPHGARRRLAPRRAPGSARATSPSPSPCSPSPVVVLVAALATSALSVRRDADDVASSGRRWPSSPSATLAVDGEPSPTPSRRWRTSRSPACLLLGATALGRAPLGPLAPHLLVTAASGAPSRRCSPSSPGRPRGSSAPACSSSASGTSPSPGPPARASRSASGPGSPAVALLGWLAAPRSPSSSLEPRQRPRPPVGFVDSLLAAGVVALGLVGHRAPSGASPPEIRRLTKVVAWVVGLASTATALVECRHLSGQHFDAPDSASPAGTPSPRSSGWPPPPALLLHSLERPSESDLALRSGLLLSAVAVAKLFLFDLAALDGVVRSVAFIATGLLLLATGSRYARAWERSRPRT